MTTAAVAPRVKGCFLELLMLFAINVPTISFGLAMGWVSLASGEGGEGETGAGGDVALVGAAAATFAAGLLGAPLGARALRAGRKPALIATSAAFGVCWSLKMAGGWCVVAGRLAAGAAGAAAWCIAPLYAREMCSERVRGAAAAAPVVAHNLGVLLMYAAADAGVQHQTVLVGCLALSVAHCGSFLFAPESPAFLAAQGDYKEARAALAWVRGVHADHPSLTEELRALPPPDEPLVTPLQLAKEMLSDKRRRRAFWIALGAVVGQETCGVLSLLQFAERVFVLARDEGAGGGAVEAGGGAMQADGGLELATPARHALVLGVVQLLASGAALYLVERVGRRPLLLFGAVTTGLCLALGAGAVRAGYGGWGAGGALAAAVGADSLGLQPVPYAILTDMFHYQYRACAVLLVTLATCVANAVETLVFPLVARAAGLWAALALAATATLAYAAAAALLVPETRGRTPDEIYDAICPGKSDSKAGCPGRHTSATSDKSRENCRPPAPSDVEGDDGIYCSETPSSVEVYEEIGVNLNRTIGRDGLRPADGVGASKNTGAKLSDDSRKTGLNPCVHDSESRAKGDDINKVPLEDAHGESIIEQTSDEVTGHQPSGQLDYSTMSKYISTSTSNDDIAEISTKSSCRLISRDDHFSESDVINQSDVTDVTEKTTKFFDESKLTNNS